MFDSSLHPGDVLSGPLVQRFAANPVGRDFVVGDLHGAFDLLDAAMEHVGFDSERDRLFCVGDLVDRGPDSARALEHLRRPYVHSVLGNHDYDFVCMSPQKVRVNAIVNYNGMRWARDLTDARIIALQETLRSCPLVIEVETEIGTVGIVHADVLEGVSWQSFIVGITTGDRRTVAGALESRWRSRAPMEEASKGVAGIDRVFVGHDPKYLGAERWGNVWAIDTGAIYRQERVIPDGYGEVTGMLTLVNVAASDDELDGQDWRSSGELAIVDAARERMRG